MRVCLLSRSDGRGGGYAAAYRLHQNLRHLDVDSKMLVGESERGDFTVLSPENKLERGWAKVTPILDKLPLLLFPKRDRTVYSLQWLPDNILSGIRKITPDVINCHWICSGFLQIETLAKFKKPIVWTLHDMWPFTGGCHYSQECDRYTKSCGACPQLNSQWDFDLSRWVWRRKKSAWRNLNLTLVTPSQWLADCARASSLFKDKRVHIIPNGLDIQRYKPVEKLLAKSLLNLPTTKKIVLFGAVNPTSDRRKGFHLLLPALQRLSATDWEDSLELVVFGSSQPIDPPHFGLNASYVGRLSDDISISLLYAAADVFVAPSVQDNLPNTVMEALACGTPCVAFKIGGMPDMIEHQQNGYLAQPYEPNDLAAGIAWILGDQERYQKLCDRAREKAVQEFSLELQAQRYLELFNEVLSTAEVK